MAHGKRWTLLIKPLMLNFLCPFCVYACIVFRNSHSPVLPFKISNACPFTRMNMFNLVMSSQHQRMQTGGNVHDSWSKIWSFPPQTEMFLGNHQPQFCIKNQYFRDLHYQGCCEWPYVTVVCTRLSNQYSILLTHYAAGGQSQIMGSPVWL